MGIPGAVTAAARPRLEPFYDTLRARVAEQVDATIAELRIWVLREHGVSVSHAAMCQALARLGPTLKKTLRAAEQDHPDIAEARDAWTALQPKRIHPAKAPAGPRLFIRALICWPSWQSLSGRRFGGWRCG
jgi:hypothetical protein